MHVLLDCTAIPANRGGVGRYIEGLLAGYTAAAASGDVPALTIVTQHDDGETLGTLAPAASVVTVSSALRSVARRLLWEQFGLPALARRVGADVIHSPHYTFPVLTRRTRLVTLHDATFFSDPDVHSGLKARFFRTWTRLAWRHAAGVIAPSLATLDEVTRYLGVAKARTWVALHGVDTDVFRAPSEEELSVFRDSVGLDADARWIAFLGTIEPRKNVPALIRAHAALGPDAPLLLIAGGRGWDAEAAALLDEAKAHPERGIRELGYLPLEQLRCLLGGAAVVAYPSSAEGFGLPVLEAMATGAAVLTTRRLALPEVGGDAVAYAEPDPASLTESLTMLLTTDTAGLRAAAVGRAANLTWQASAETHLAAYRAIAKNARG